MTTKQEIFLAVAVAAVAAYWIYKQGKRSTYGDVSQTNASSGENTSIWSNADNPPIMLE